MTDMQSEDASIPQLCDMIRAKVDELDKIWQGRYPNTVAQVQFWTKGKPDVSPHRRKERLCFVSFDRGLKIEFNGEPSRPIRSASLSQLTAMMTAIGELGLTLRLRKRYE